MVGSQRFLQRLWRNVVDEETGDLVTRDTDIDEATLHALHKTIDAVNKDYENLSFNTAIARLTEYNTVLTALKVVPRAAVEPLVLMVAPLAPHIAEELWHRLGHDQSLAHEPSPSPIRNWWPRTPSPPSSRSGASCAPSWRSPPRSPRNELRELALAHPRIVKEIPNGVRKVIVKGPQAGQRRPGLTLRAGRLSWFRSARPVNTGG